MSGNCWGQYKVMVHLEQYQLMPQAVFALAQCVDPTSYRRYALPDIQVEPLHKGRIDLPAAGRQHLLDRLQRAEHDAMRHVDQTPAPHGLHHLRIEEPGQRHPTGLGWGAFLLAPLGLNSGTKMAQDGRQVIFEAITEKQGDAVRGYAVNHLVQHPLGHRQGTCDQHRSGAA